MTKIVQAKKKNCCSCGRNECKLTGIFGDTSVGNGQVWHGSLDIIINNELVVEPVEEKTESPGGKSPVEVKTKSTSLSKNPQIIAETVVFSFLQKQTHPERTNFLTPCIAVGSSEMLVMFYDAEHDVLLESSKIPLFELVEEMPKKVNLVAILVSWLVVNYKYLCSGLTEEMIDSYKAELFSHIKDKKDIYENKLALGNVGISVSSKENSRKRETIVRSKYLFKKHQKLSRMLFREKTDSSGESSNE